MNKKRIFILTALILAVCIVFSAFAVACDKNGGDSNNNDKDSTLLFTNGTFASGTSNSALTSPSNWTGAAGSTASSNSSSFTPSDDEALTKGVVGTSSSGWKALQKQYKHITSSSPGRGKSSEGNDELDDNKVLMINNRKDTSYKYTSQSHTLDTDSYYKLSVDVKTILASNVDSKGNPTGAYVYVNGAAYAGWEAIDTKNAWETFTLYIETSELASGSITVVLSLGVGNGSSGRLARGFAFFDNVVLEKISKADKDEDSQEAYNKAKEEYDNLELSSNVSKYSMKIADGEFNYASSIVSAPYTPSKYNQVTGFGSGESAPSSSSDLAKGIIDTATFSISDVANNLSSLSSALAKENLTLAQLETPEASVGTRMLYIQNKRDTAFGYRADVEMNFKLNKYYKVSVWARTFLEKGMASIRLTDGTNTDSNNYTIDIDTNGEWAQYSFYVQANQFRSTQLKLELWLGYGGKADDTLAKGVALFDATTLTEITEQEYENATNSSTINKINLLTDEDKMDPIDLKTFKVQDPDNLNSTLAGYSTADVIDTDESEELKEFPGKPVDKANTDALNSKVLVIDNARPTATTLSTLTVSNKEINKDNLIPIATNKAYAISMYVKTKDIDTSKGMNIALLRYNDDYKPGDKFENAYSEISTFSNLNTENLEDEKGFNDYTLITFYVLGDQLKDAQLGISITLGSGDGSDYSTLVMGYGYVSSMNIEQVDYSQYSSASNSTTVKTVDLTDIASDNEVSSNGYFKKIDLSATVNLFGNDIFAPDGSLNKALALPSNWTINSSSKLTEKDGDNYKFDYMAGVLNLKNDTQYTALGIDNVNTFYNGVSQYFNLDKNPTVLAIKKGEDIQTLGFKSNSISLSANSYYAFMVYAKADDGSEFSITLSTATNNSNDKTKFIGDGYWHQYMIFIATGISSSSVTLSLNADSDTYNSSTVFFTGATYTSIDEKAFESAQEQSNENWLAQSWLIDSFDDIDSADSIADAKNFNGALIDSSASSDSDTLVSGVIDRNKTNYSDIDLDVDGDDENIVDAIFTNPQDSEGNDLTNIGDRVLVIYNKEASAYGYTSNTATIKPGKYYQISVWVLTYKLALNSKAGTDIDKKFVPTATITLKANNKTYEFGRKLTDSSSEDDGKRIVNTSTYDDENNETIGKWTQYSFYIFAEEDIEDTTATLTVSLGFTNKNYYLTGYVFVDNFSVEEIEEAKFIAREEVYKYVEAEDGNYFLQDGNYVEITDTTSAPAGAKLYNKVAMTDSEVAKEDNSKNSILANKEDIPNNFRIVFTADDSTAEPVDDDPTTPTKEKDPLMWLYISLGAVSAIIVVIVVIVVIKKLIPKKKKKLIKNSKNKKTSSANASKRDQFGK